MAHRITANNDPLDQRGGGRVLRGLSIYDVGVRMGCCSIVQYADNFSFWKNISITHCQQQRFYDRQCCHSGDIR